MKKRIDIQGMSTTAAYKDGDCRVMLNLRKKNGVLRPVTPRKEVRTLAYTYDYMFQHNLPQTGENLLGVRAGKLYWIKRDNSEVELVAVNNLRSITQIGNIVNILDDGGIRHAWWSDGSYKIFSSSFEGGQSDGIIGPLKVELKVEGIQHDLERLMTYHWSETDTPWHGNDQDTINSRRALSAGMLQKAYAKHAADGELKGFSMAIIAFELYDGTYALQGAPTLLGQSWDANTRYSGLTIGPNTYDYYNSPAKYHPLSTDGISIFFVDEVFTANVDISYDERWYKKIRSGSKMQAGVGNVSGQSTARTSFFGDMCTTYTLIETPQIGSKKKLVAITSANKLQFRISNNISQSYQNLIKSVSVFMSPEVSMFKINEDCQYIGFYDGNGTNSGKTENYLPSRKTNAEILKELSDNQQFYKVYEISFDQLQAIAPNTWIDIDLKGKLGENLKYQDELPVGNTHTLLPKSQLAYNAKLHALGYTQELFRGWPVNYFHDITQTGQYNADDYGTIPNERWLEWVSVKIKTEGGTSKVVRVTHQASQSDLLQLKGLQSMISYPDARAFEITFHRNFWNETFSRFDYSEKVYPLMASETHNFAYYINPDLKPNNWAYPFTNSSSNGAIGIPPAEANRTLYYRNAIKVSLGNNPFYFPPEAVMTVGTGNILAGGANAMQMSEGQFGQYDLYILTDEGIYSLDTGTTINYNRISPASLEVPTSNIICNTPHGLVFVGRKGAYILAGASPMHISAALEEAATYTKVGAIDYDFNEFLKTLSDIMYNPFEREIIFVGADDYHYVFHIDSKAWYISTEPISIEVKNAQPQLLVAVNDKIKSYNMSQSNMAQIGFELRPMYFGVDEVKKMQKAVIRGQFKYLNTDVFSNEPFLSIYGSRDAIEQKMLRGWKIPSNLQGRNYKDFDSGMMAKTSFRSYIVAMKAEVDEKSSIEYIDFDISDPLNNDKMR